MKVVSPQDMTDAEVQEPILASVKQLQLPGKGESKPELAVFSRHTPFELRLVESNSRRLLRETVWAARRASYLLHGCGFPHARRFLALAVYRETVTKYNGGLATVS